MKFSFIHTSDWQLGAPFASFDKELSPLLKKARLNMIERIGDLAEDKSLQHVVVAGDVWDSEQPSDDTIRKPLDIMGAKREIMWWLMPGNHDPFRKNMLWDRIQKRAPQNVKFLLEETPVEVEKDVWFLPAPWKSKFPDRDLTTWMEDVALPEESIKIGIAHGSLWGFSSGGDESEERSIIDPNRVESVGLDYLALGDWHGYLKINDRIAYSGTPEPDRFKDNDPGNVLVVELEKGCNPQISVEKSSEYSWRIIDLLCLQDTDSFPQLEELEAVPSLGNVLLQINLKGEITQGDFVKLEKRLRELEERVAYMEKNDDSLTRLVSDDDLNLLSADSTLKLAGERLKNLKEDLNLTVGDRKIAEDALKMLLSYSAEEME